MGAALFCHSNGASTRRMERKRRRIQEWPRHCSSVTGWLRNCVLMKSRLMSSTVGVVVEQYRVLKVEEHTAVVQIDRAYHSAAVVRDHDLGMDKAGRILKNLHARLQQGLVVGTG